MKKEAPQYPSIVFVPNSGESIDSGNIFVYDTVDSELDAVKSHILQYGQVLFPSDDFRFEYLVYDLGYQKFDNNEEIVEEIDEETWRSTTYASLENAVNSPIYDAWEVGDHGREGFEHGFILFCKDEEKSDSQFMYCASGRAENPYQCFATRLSEDMTDSPDSAQYAVLSFDRNLYGYVTDLLSGCWDDTATDEATNQSEQIASMILDYAEQESKVLYLA